ncbi:hypothetical protein HOH45_05025 [bacterium]|nr:hypothetical protein [bacterium]
MDSLQLVPSLSGVLTKTLVPKPIHSNPPSSFFKTSFSKKSSLRMSYPPENKENSNPSEKFRLGTNPSLSVDLSHFSADIVQLVINRTSNLATSSPTFRSSATSSDIIDIVHSAIADFKFDYNGFLSLLRIITPKNALSEPSSASPLTTLRNLFSDAHRSEFPYLNAGNCSGLSHTVETLFASHQTIKPHTILEQIVTSRNTLNHPTHAANAILCSDDVCIFIDVMAPVQVVSLNLDEEVRVKNPRVPQDTANYTALTLLKTPTGAFYIEKCVHSQKNTKDGKIETNPVITSIFLLKKYTNTAELVDAVYINKDGGSKYVYSILGYKRPSLEPQTAQSTGGKSTAAESQTATSGPASPISNLELKGTSGIILDATDMTLKFRHSPIDSDKYKESKCSLESLKHSSSDQQCTYTIETSNGEACHLEFNRKEDGTLCFSKATTDSKTLRKIFKPEFFSAFHLDIGIIFDQLLEIKGKQPLIRKFIHELETIKTEHRAKTEGAPLHLPRTLLPIRDKCRRPILMPISSEADKKTPVKGKAKHTSDSPTSVQDVYGLEDFKHSFYPITLPPIGLKEV